jgi:hypothetical protein
VDEVRGIVALRTKAEDSDLRDAVNGSDYVFNRKATSPFKTCGFYTFMN